MTLYDSLVKEVASVNKTIEKLRTIPKKGQRLNAETIKDNAGTKIDIANLVVETANRLIECIPLMGKSIGAINDLIESTDALHIAADGSLHLSYYS